MILNTSQKKKCSPLHVVNTRDTAYPLSLAQLAIAQGRKGMGRSRHPSGSCMHREISSVATAFGPVSFLSLCHHWLKVNALIFKCLSEKGRKRPGRKKSKSKQENERQTWAASFPPLSCSCLESTQVSYAHLRAAAFSALQTEAL